jgi:hypothetical protein
MSDLAGALDDQLEFARDNAHARANLAAIKEQLSRALREYNGLLSATRAKRTELSELNTEIERRSAFRDAINAEIEAARQRFGG